MAIKTLAELVDDLFHHYRHPSGREYKYVEVSRALDGSNDPTYFSKLRAGKIQNPSRSSLLALCTFFQVPSDYFFPELAGLDLAMPCDQDKEAALLHALRNIAPELQDSIYDLVQKMQQQSLALADGQTKEHGA